MKQIRKITAAVLSVLLIGAQTVSAETEPSEKEEVIYMMTDASGKVTDIEAVNIFAGGDIVDYGDYSAVKMLNTTDAITQNGDQITFSSDAAKVYYQGTMKNLTSPWNISILYFLDGTEYSPDDIAGKSGALEIHFSVTKNNAYSGNFYDSYALEAAFTLDTDLFTSIRADGATIANAGSDKQISYIILPGKGIDAVIYADVTDFELDAVTINGVRLNMDVDIDDSELMEKVNDLVSAIDDIDSGASELNSGTETLSSASETLNEKVSELNSGVGSLTDGAGQLSSGLSEIAGKNDQLTSAAYTAYEGLCNAEASALNTMLAENGMDAVALTPSTYSSVLMDLLAKMDADSVYQQAFQAALQQVTAQVDAQADTLYSGYVQSQADSICQSYLASQADTLYAAAAKQAVSAQLVQNGYSEEQAAAYLETEDGQAMIAEAAAALTDDQKAQVLSTALSSLTDEQKAQILQAALESLTDDQKMQIREAYIAQMMASDEVTTQINSAVAEVSSAAEQVSALKGQLDSYGSFYQGIVDYTSAVSSAASGAGTLKSNMDTLYASTGTLSSSVSELNDAIQKLNGGTRELADGTSGFADQTSDMDTQISGEIDDITSSITGEDTGTVSFVSAENTNVKSVQFVIKTAAIEKAETAAETEPGETTMTFWQKLLSLFGIE
ncbi:MAG: hypothetical protein ACI4WR_04155 [Bulleidia sp.]